MTASRLATLGTISPRRMALLLSAGLVSLLLILVIGASLRNQTVVRVQDQIAEARTNLSNLAVIESEELTALEVRLAEVQAQISGLEADVPSAGSAFQVYRRSFDLAVGLQAELVSIALTGSQLEPTVAGQVEADIYRLELLADQATCLSLIGRLEDEAGPTLAIDDLAIDTATNGCSFTLAVVRLAE